MRSSKLRWPRKPLPTAIAASYLLVREQGGAAISFDRTQNLNIQLYMAGIIRVKILVTCARLGSALSGIFSDTSRFDRVISKTPHLIVTDGDDGVVEGIHREHGDEACLIILRKSLINDRRKAGTTMVSSIEEAASRAKGRVYIEMHEDRRKPLEEFYRTIAHTQARVLRMQKTSRKYVLPNTLRGRR